METGRPLAGYVTFCPGAINVDGNLTDMLEDAVHQVTCRKFIIHTTIFILLLTITFTKIPRTTTLTFPMAVSAADCPRLVHVWESCTPL